MADNSSRLWLQQRLNQNSIQRALEMIQVTGKGLPCHVTAVSGSIVTVAFDVNTQGFTLPEVTIPKVESTWLRNPTQVGDKGITIPADTYIGGISGLGSGIADLTTPGNLSALVFAPISNANSGPIDPNSAQVTGPEGVILQSSDGSVSIKANTTSGITMSFGGHSISINSSGVTIDGVLWDTHTHIYSPGSGTPTNTGGPV